MEVILHCSLFSSVTEISFELFLCYSCLLETTNPGVITYILVSTFNIWCNYYRFSKKKKQTRKKNVLQLEQSLNITIEIDHLSRDEHYKTITEMKQFDPISLKHR
jgi:hypothetical protein